YGGISIKTHTRIAALLYALFGIPLVLFYLSVMGDGLSTIMRCLFRLLRTCGTKRSRSESTSGQSSGNNSNSSSSTGIGRNDNGSIVDKSFHSTSLVAGKLSTDKQNYENNYSNQIYNYSYYQHSNGVPIPISIMIVICYITGGAALFHRIQAWNVLESLYFCFTSLGTIGFGELEPKGYAAQYAASAYILIGMAIVAMCFNLIRSEIKIWLRRFGGERSEEKSHASTISGPGRNVGGSIAQNSFAHLMPHHNHLMHQLPSRTGPIEDVALVTVAVAPKS
ncbi:TWiK family of potassium channels protein 12-like, partial [Contarinia nasturtii]|uniref:TWiK family of potassium channels protein 12-like n=1 Tax=Contarinia nasturtii TaxID=265458 RepID=UPI0012D40376